MCPHCSGADEIAGSMASYRYSPAKRLCGAKPTNWDVTLCEHPKKHEPVLSFRLEASQEQSDC
jgi:hypothetical protein